MPEALKDHQVTHVARFRQKLTKPITLYVTGLHALLLGFLGGVLLGAVGAVAGVLVALIGAVAATWSSGQSAADVDFIESYAKARGFTVRPRYRLPQVTPLLEISGPVGADGIGYPSREFEGELTLGDGTKVHFVHTTIWLQYQPEPPQVEAPVSSPNITAFVVDLPPVAEPLGLVLCDAPATPGTRVRCDRLPRLRRIGPTREFFRAHSICVDESVADELVAQIYTRGGSRLSEPEAISWQVEGANLVVWTMGPAESTEDLDRALDSVGILSSAVLSAADHLGPRASVAADRALRPVEPSSAPSPWLDVAKRLGLEYWEHSALRRETPLGTLGPYCGHTVAGSIDGRCDGSLSWVKFRDPYTDEHRTVPPTYRLVVFSTEITEARGAIPNLVCTSRRSKYQPYPPITYPGVVARWEPLNQESARFQDRYVVETPSDNENMLRQLFSPAFILWHAELEAETFGWQLADGVFVAFVTAKSGPSKESILDLCDAGMRVAERVQSEALESRW